MYHLMEYTSVGEGDSRWKGHNDLELRKWFWESYTSCIYIYNPYHEVESNLANIMSDHMIYNTEWELLFRAIEVCHFQVNAMMNI